MALVTGLTANTPDSVNTSPAAIDFDVETAFNYCGSRGRLKQFTQCRALLTTDGQITPGLGLNVDFAQESTVGPTTFEQSSGDLWDVGNWDEGVWPQTSRVITDWATVEGEGYCAGPRMAGSITAETTAQQSNSLILAINGWDLLMLDGAFQ